MRTTGTVKWFDPGKGEGCVVSEGGTQAALSRATLNLAGRETIAPGTPLTYEVKLTGETLTVTAIYEIEGRPPSTAARKRKPRTQAKVPASGFGFITSNDVAGDVLIHRSVIEDHGDAARADGTTIDTDIVEKLRGLQARRLPLHRNDMEALAGPWADAECKWFSRPKGFGFVVLRGDTEEVFVHMDTLRRCNVHELRAGQSVRVRVARTPRGLMVIAIAVVP